MAPHDWITMCYLLGASIVALWAAWPAFRKDD